MRATLEHCAETGIALEAADLRRFRLDNGNYDGLKANGACFWGASLKRADLGFAEIHNGDFRSTDLSDVCFAHSNLAQSDFSGAYFSNTIFDGAILEGVMASCPSFWSVDLKSAKSLSGVVFYHKGEERLTFNKAPLVIKGMPHALIMTEDWLIWNGEAHLSVEKYRDFPGYVQFFSQCAASYFSV